MGDTAAVRITVAVILAAVAVTGVAAETHHVVGGWEPGSNVTAWLAGRVFRVGDKLWFNEDAGREKIVVEVNGPEELEACELTNPIRMYTDHVPLDREGLRYFASGDPESCRSGLKLPVSVHPHHHEDFDPPPYGPFDPPHWPPSSPPPEFQAPPPPFGPFDPPHWPPDSSPPPPHWSPDSSPPPPHWPPVHPPPESHAPPPPRPFEPPPEPVRPPPPPPPFGPYDPPPEPVHPPPKSPPPPYAGARKNVPSLVIFVWCWLYVMFAM